MCNSGDVQFELRVFRFRCVIEMTGITCGHEKGSPPVPPIPLEAIVAVGSDVLATGLGLGLVCNAFAIHVAVTDARVYGWT